MKVKIWLYVIVFSLFFPAKIFAQEKPATITVWPSIAQIDLSTDQPQAILNYRNDGTVPLTLSFSAEDFTVLEDSYKLQYLSGNDAKNYKYSLSSWLTFEQQSLRLNPGEQKSLKIFIDKNRITKGGHYASILAQIGSDEPTHKVAIKGVLSSLLFVRASTGQELEQGNIVSLRADQNHFEFPGNFVLRFSDTGNVEVVPYGLLEIYDSFGHKVAKGVLNEDSNMVLPETIRRFDIPVLKLVNFLAPGNYTAILKLHFGKSNRTLTNRLSFVTYGSKDNIGWGAAILVVLAAILVLLRIFKPRKKTD